MTKTLAFLSVLTTIFSEESIVPSYILLKNYINRYASKVTIVYAPSSYCVRDGKLDVKSVILPANTERPERKK